MMNQMRKGELDVEVLFHNRNGFNRLGANEICRLAKITAKGARLTSFSVQFENVPKKKQR